MWHQYLQQVVAVTLPSLLSTPIYVPKSTYLNYTAALPLCWQLDGTQAIRARAEEKSQVTPQPQEEMRTEV